MLFGLVGGKKGSSKPTVKQIVTQLKLPNKGVMWKGAKKEVKRVLPYITEEELEEVHQQFKDSGEVHIRLSDKEAALFKTLNINTRRKPLVPLEEYECCGHGVVCGNGCAMDVQSSKFMGPTDLGLDPVPIKGGGGEDSCPDDDECFTAVEAL